ncbi:hypothetical protein BDW59DRAFT_163400 [Aspergillus cavernicola]|uniref:Hydroxyneurosporene synthase n=1 Tax=Aspergillus cavernicola TaxID=176166 RepID=A0ABR4I637_9EURO
MRATSFFSSFLLSQLAAAAVPHLAAPAVPPPATYVIPKGRVEGTTAADSVVGVTAFDGPHISVNNGSAYQWWYFDAVSPDADTIVVAQFYPGWLPDASAILLNVVYPNGTLIDQKIPAGALQLSTTGDGSQGYVDNGAMTWFGASDLSAYHLTLDLPEVGISGTITMRSKAPAHVAGGLNVPGASFDYAPFLAWGNPVPDADATVDLVVNGTSLSFTGTGYHDQNWGAATYGNNLNQWYWGHSSVGIYSLVFFYHLDEELNVTSSGYLARNGEPIISGFSNVEVTPQGPGTSVPLVNGATIEGWEVRINDTQHGEFLFNIENTVLTSRDRIYSRYIGRTTGGPVGGGNQTGVAVVELMKNRLMVLQGLQ